MKNNIFLISWPDYLPNEADLINEILGLGEFNFHLRKKELEIKNLEELIKKIKPEFHNRIIVHQYFEQAKQYNLGGIHLTEGARKLVSVNENTELKLVSTSIHNLMEYNSERKKYNYIFYSPVFSSLSKNNHHPTLSQAKLKIGLNEIKPNNLIALGGINLENFHSALSMGFNGVAILGSVWKSESPVTYMSEFIKVFNGVSR